jgi:glyoxylase-like metal-dependent hydrolase (beta-lactamase superfamily II)
MIFEHISKFRSRSESNLRSRSFRGLQSLLILGAVMSVSVNAAAGAEDVDFKIGKNPVLDTEQAGYYRMKLGKVDVITLSDGSAALGLEEVVLNEKPGELERLLSFTYEKSPVHCSINGFLIHLNGRWIMVDAGASELIGPTAGKLPDSLSRLGVKPEEISDIYITHVHPDHTGGLTLGSTRVFPNATIHINKREMDYWFDKSAAAKSHEPIKSFFAQAEIKLRPYMDAGQIKTFDDVTEFAPGFKSQPAYGHTPGHTFYVLEDGGQKMVFVGDLVHIPSVQFDDPNIAMRFDCDSPQAVKTRKALFADAAQKGYLVVGDHLQFPGTGHIHSDGDHYRWIPVPYINDAIKK